MKKYYWLFLASFSLLGCNESLPQSKPQELDAKINDLSKKLELTQSQLNQTQSQLEELNLSVSQVSTNELLRSFEKIAFLKIGVSEYQPIVTHIGTITVSISDVEAFANGSKVSLLFGNPLSASIGEVKFKVDYGALDKDGVVIKDSEKTKEVNLPQRLNAASWNKVSILLEGLPVSELGYIRVHDFNVSTIFLYGKTAQ